MAERPEDLNLPNAVITRIIKEALPEGVNVSKDARVAMSKAASIFVLYATSCANNFAMKNKRKTIGAADVMAAMEDMEFERFTDPLKTSLNAYKKEQQGKKEATEKKKKAREQDNATENEKEAAGEEEDDNEDASEEEQKEDIEEVVIEDDEEEEEET